MDSSPAPLQSGETPPPRLKIYFLPNLLTAGNLFCGFVALTMIVQADLSADHYETGVIRKAIGFILLACIFDLFDGRVARMGGCESPFGREFDSLADLVSFGVAPAFLVHRIVLDEVFVSIPEIGWLVASVYLICGALRLARFNCLSAMNTGSSSGEFLGFPIPAAAGLVTSITLLLLWLKDKDLAASGWHYLLPPILLFLSVMMISEVRYPSFKSLDLRSTRAFTKMVIAIIFVGMIIILREKILVVMLPAMFSLYLLYGFVRPYISLKMRKEIEEEEEEETEEEIR